MALSVVLFVALYQRRIIKHQVELKTIEAQRQMDLLQASLQSEEEERKRIAAELHDDIGATLSSARLFLHQAEKTAADPKLIQQSGQLVDDSIKKVRAVSHKLQPTTLQALGLASSLNALADLYNNTGRLTVGVEITGTTKRLPDHTELHVYRIVQELINNLIRHSQAQKVLITLSPEHNGINLAVQHDGKGITDEEFQNLLKSKNGIGLKNIANRVEFIKGSISFTNNKAGYRVQLKVPVQMPQ